MMSSGGNGPGEETKKRAVPGGALPEHAEQESREQRCIDEREDELEIIHHVLEAHSDIRGADAKENPNERGPTPHAQVVLVGLVRLDVRLIQVVGPYRVESRYVAGHARHEARQERGES